MDIENKLETYEQIYYNSVETLADEIRTTIVIPFCNKHKLNFFAGMGIYGFSTKTRRIIHIQDYPNKEFKKLYELLETPIPIYDHCIGSWIEDYNLLKKGDQP